MARRPRRALTWLLATALTCLVAAGCDKPAEEDSGESTTTEETAPTEPTDPTPAPSEPEIVVDPLARYAEHLATEALAVGLFHPARLSTALAAELDAGAGSEVAASLEASQARLVERIGPFEALMRPQGWQDTGLDATRPVAFAITTGPARALRDAFGELSPNLNAIETVSDLVYEAGQARNAEADAEVTAKADALRDKLHAVGFGVRLAVPVTDTDTALASLATMLEGAGFTADDAPHEGYLASYRSATGLPVHVRSATEDLLIVDGAWLPGDTDDPEARAAAGTTLVSVIDTGRPSLQVPAFDEGALLSITIDPADLSRLDYLMGIERALGKLDALQALSRGRRAEPGNTLLEEDFSQLKYTVGMLDEVVRRGPFAGWSVTVRARSEGAPLEVVSRGLLREPRDSLADIDATSPALQIDNALLTVTANPMIAASEGPWAEAGLSAGKWTAPETLSKSASMGQMPAWMGHPAMLGLWLYPLPSAAWREHAPEALEDLVPGADRIELAVGLGSTEPVLVAVDGADQLEAWRSALACVAAGKSTATGCDASKIPGDAPGEVTFGDKDLPFGEVTLNVRAASRDDRTIVAVSREAAPITALDASPVDTAPGVFSASLDLGALGGAGLPAGLVGIAEGLQAWVRGMELVTTVEREAVVWTLSVDSDVALLLGVHGLLDTLPVSPPSISALISLSLAGLYDHKPIEIEGPPTERTASSSSGKSTKTAKAVDPANLAGIKKTFDANRGQVEKCAQRIKQKFGSASGELAVMVYLEANGTVDKVRVRRDDVGNGLGRCVAESIKGWSFPPQGDYVQVGKKWKL